MELTMTLLVVCYQHSDVSRCTITFSSLTSAPLGDMVVTTDLREIKSFIA